MQKPVESLDLQGIPCPQNSVRALMKLAGMAEGTVLELIVDDGEPIANVPLSLENEGYTIIRREKNNSGWNLLVRKE